MSACGIVDHVGYSSLEKGRVDHNARKRFGDLDDYVLRLMAEAGQCGRHDLIQSNWPDR